MRKNINIYTDGSQKTDIKHTSFSGYLLVDNEEEVIHIRPTNDLYTSEKTNYNYLSNGSGAAEIIAYMNALQKCLSYKNTDFNVYTDYLDILEVLKSNKRKGLMYNLKVLYTELISKNKELGNTITTLWVESHKECWGNIKIDKLINLYICKYRLEHNFLPNTTKMDKKRSSEKKIEALKNSIRDREKHLLSY